MVGGSFDAALCADLLATGWDQVGFNAVSSPAAAVAEEAAGVWLKDLLGIPAHATCGFVTGGQAANTVGLLAARQQVLGAVGWDVERDGLIGAPRVRVVAGAERHGTIDRALRFVGLGAGSVVEIPADDNGAMRAEALAAVLAEDGDVPTIVCAQSGNVNTGACDDLRADLRRGALTPARGSTSTVRSDCGPQRARARVISSTASSSPIRGRATATSGSTCRTTPATRSAHTRTSTAPP